MQMNIATTNMKEHLLILLIYLAKKLENRLNYCIMLNVLQIVLKEFCTIIVRVFSVMDCMLPLVEGCDQKTLESVTGAPGQSVTNLKDMQKMICSSSCKIDEIQNCQKPGSDTETVCR